MTVYGPRCVAHPDRIGSAKTQANRLLVIHTSEGSEGDAQAENLCSFIKLPGDRISDSGRRYGSSYHYLIDTDRVLPCVPDSLWAFHAAGANNFSIGLCLPGKAGQTPAQWQDDISSAGIHQLAGVMVDKATEYRIPLNRLTVAQIQAGASGYCGHYDISRAYHQSDHTDPGPNFAWPLLDQEIRALTLPPPPPPGDDMELHRKPPRIYVTDPADKSDPNTVVDPAGAVYPGQKRIVRLPLTGFSQARVQITVRPIDSAGFLRAAPANEDLTSHVHSNLNWGLAQPESSPVEVLLDGNGDSFAFLANANCHVLIDWLGWRV